MTQNCINIQVSSCFASPDWVLAAQYNSWLDFVWKTTFVSIAALYVSIKSTSFLTADTNVARCSMAADFLICAFKA